MQTEHAVQSRSGTLNRAYLHQPVSQSASHAVGQVVGQSGSQSGTRNGENISRESERECDDALFSAGSSYCLILRDFQEK